MSIFGSQQHVAICAGIYLQQVRLLPGFSMPACKAMTVQGAYMYTCTFVYVLVSCEAVARYHVCVSVWFILSHHTSRTGLTEVCLADRDTILFTHTRASVARMIAGVWACDM